VIPAAGRPATALLATSAACSSACTSLSYGQARALLDAHTALGGPGTGWDPHELRHSALTHLGEAGAGLLMLMAKSRHKKPENVRRYFHPAPEAIGEETSLLGPGNRRR
jgi:integrase/recombinase XerC